MRGGLLIRGGGICNDLLLDQMPEETILHVAQCREMGRGVVNSHT